MAISLISVDYRRLAGVGMGRQPAHKARAHKGAVANKRISLETSKRETIIKESRISKVCDQSPPVIISKENIMSIFTR